MSKLLRIAIVMGLSALIPGVVAAAEYSPKKTLMFDVFLDGKKIGYHRFEIDGSKQDAAVRSEASFDVKFLFLTAFSYRHSTTERWDEGCLERIESRTNTNGETLSVMGSQTDDGFIVEAGEREAELPECVSTFAYWNPGFLQKSRLLNPQTGEYLEVDVEELGPDTVRVGGTKVRARKLRLTAKQMDIKLWYSEDSEWLALESVATGGRVIRYELS